LVEDQEVRAREQTAEDLAKENIRETRAAELLEQEKDHLDELLELLEQKLARQMEQTPNVRTLSRLKAVRDARAQKRKNVNSGLLTEVLADRLVKGKTIWQR
ncbi:MAG: hypothetical protein J6X30_01570, partial [Clostridia bacterium]|nr:hypothetical protein [Clostridia bacterium]